MTDDELTAAVEAMVDERDKALVPAYLPMAKSKVMGWLWPFEKSPDWADVPEKHHPATAEICAYLIDKRGGEGEVRHVENGTTREWESGSVPLSMLENMTPFAGVPE